MLLDKMFSLHRLNAKIYRIVSALIGGLVSGLAGGLIMVSIKLLGSERATINGLPADTFSMIFALVAGVVGGLAAGIFYANPKQKINGFRAGFIGGIISVVVLSVAFVCLLVAAFAFSLKD